MKYVYVVLSLFITLFSDAQTTLVDSFLHQGIMREYRLYIPASYTATQAVPLLLNLHGYTSNMNEQEQYADFRSIADTANFIIAHPNGVADSGGIRSWSCFGIGTINDVDFLSKLIDRIQQNYSIQSQRIYSTGFSNGGFMSYELACKLSHRIAAIASVTGSMAVTQLINCNPSRAVPVLQVHGTLDPTVAYNGSALFLSMDSLLSYWVQKNQCTPTPQVNAVPDIVTSDLCTAEHAVYTGGLANSTIEFYKILGGKHTWPGAPINLSVTNMDFSASKEIWRFFSQYTIQGANQVSTTNQEPIVQFANPVYGELNLQWHTNKPIQVTLFNSLGQVEYSSKELQPVHSISLKHAGYYILQVQTDDAVVRYPVLNMQ